MPTKIRLSRQGRKRIPIYHVVVADSRAPRDGKYIERLGIYNPKTNPATIQIDFDRALYWLQTGAQPTDTCRAILSDNGVLYKNHLLNGVKKNALTLEQVESKFAAWQSEKEKKAEDKKNALLENKNKTRKQILEAESKVREAKAAAVAKKLQDAKAVPVEEAPANEVSEEPANEA
jgi:small subunit ribosomal protein S16